MLISIFSGSRCVWRGYSNCNDCKRFWAGIVKYNWLDHWHWLTDQLTDHLLLQTMHCMGFRQWWVDWLVVVVVVVLCRCLMLMHNLRKAWSVLRWKPQQKWVQLRKVHCHSFHPVPVTEESCFAKKGCFFIQAWLHTQYCNASNAELILLRATIGAPILISRLLLRMHRMYVVSIRLDFN